MKSISIILPTINSGGAEKQAVLLSVLLSQYYSVHLIIFYGDEPEYRRNTDLLSNSTVKVHKLRGNLFSKIRKVYLLLKHSDTQVLFNYLSLPDIIGSFVGKSLHIRTYNGIRNTRLTFKKELCEKLVHNNLASGTIFNCYSGSKYFSSRGFDSQKCIVIPNGIEINKPVYREDKPVKTIITVGRFDSQKDYKTLIASVANLSRTDFRLCIVGYGVLESQIRSWIKEYKIEDKTDIYIKPDNVPELERNADIYLSTSLFEGTSNSIMEALNWSLPVVATNVGDNAHLVIDGENGYLHPVGDYQGISSSLGKLLDDACLRNNMGLKSNRNLRENYSIEIFEKRYIDLIEGK